MPKYKVDVRPAVVKKLLVDQSLLMVAYCRVSISSDEQLGSLENQIEFYTKSIFKQSNWILAGIYSDNTSGVRAKKRNGYQQIMKGGERKTDLIFVKSIRCFGRDTLITIKVYGVTCSSDTPKPMLVITDCALDPLTING